MNDLTCLLCGVNVASPSAAIAHLDAVHPQRGTRVGIERERQPVKLALYPDAPGMTDCGCQPLQCHMEGDDLVCSTCGTVIA